MAPERSASAFLRNAMIVGICRVLLLAGLGIPLWTLNAQGASEAKIDFDVPPGEAVTAFRTFSRQSGEEIVYLVDQVRALKTKGASGKLTPREALDQMLEGSELSAVQDQATGAFAIRRT